MSSQLPWHNHKFVKDPRYNHCKLCGWSRDVPHYTKKRPRNPIRRVLNRKKWRIYG